MIYDRVTKSYINEKESNLLKFLYSNIFGRLIIKLLTYKFFTKLGELYMNSRLSKLKIKRFIKKNNIDMNEYKETEYKNFDEFFIRDIELKNRPLLLEENLLVSPCDSKLSIYKIDSSTNISIKNSFYTISELLQDDSLAQKYKDGYCLVFRLCVDDYHHYYYIDDGKIISRKKINGRFNTVRPIALKHAKVFSENTREYCVIDSKNFGNIIQMEVGALMVGKICNLPKDSFSRGDEKGYFRFGGSTVVLLFEHDKIVFDDDILDKVDKDIEIKVKLFDVIGRRV